MLRNRSRSAMTTKKQQASYNSSQSSSSSPSAENYKTQVPSIFGSPRFKAFTKALAETDVAAAAAAAGKSPTSILDTKQFSPSCNNNHSPFWDHDIILNPQRSPKPFSSENKHKGIGLALFDDEAIEANSSSVFFGTKLRVQIPPPLTQSPKSPSGSADSSATRTEVNCTECPSATDMELSEEYTRVISHGPNPKTTHIFDNSIIESYCSLLSDTKSNDSAAPENFLGFCHTCRKNLEQKDDIYIYRGEKAFCSQECRYQEMLLDDEVEN